ncbi:MAG: hypothetical protein ACOX2O_01925 [Bdellovibrionota bacterium]
MTIKKQIAEKYLHICQKITSACVAPTKLQIQFILLACGVTLLIVGLSLNVVADGYMGGTVSINYNDERLADATNAILTYIEGSFGAMVMVAAGIMAILSAAVGNYKAALGLLVVAVSAFALRSLIGTFFNDLNIQP